MAKSEEMVKIRLHRGKDDPETHPVVINGNLFQVPRGVETEVSQHVYEVLQAAELV